MHLGLRLIARLMQGSVMFDLNNEIARLEMRSEQMIIHLRSLGRATRDAGEVRSQVLAMLERLVSLKTKRQFEEVALELNDAA